MIKKVAGSNPSPSGVSVVRHGASVGYRDIGIIEHPGKSLILKILLLFIMIDDVLEPLPLPRRPSATLYRLKS